MQSDFISFLVALWSEWKVFLTGGSVVAVMTLWNLAGRKPLSHDANWLILGFTFILASFMAWRKERLEAGRDIINVRPSALAELYKGGTEVQGDTLVRPYIGMRIKATGTVTDVKRSFPLSYLFLKSDGVMLSLMIPSWAFDRFTVFSKGAVITVVGRIDSVWDRGVRLTQCALARAEESQTASATQSAPNP